MGVWVLMTTVEIYKLRFGIDRQTDIQKVDRDKHLNRIKLLQFKFCKLRKATDVTNIESSHTIQTNV